MCHYWKLRCFEFSLIPTHIHTQLLNLIIALSFFKSLFDFLLTLTSPTYATQYLFESIEYWPYYLNPFKVIYKFPLTEDPIRFGVNDFKELLID